MKSSIIIMEGSSTLFCTSKIAMGTRKNFFEIYEQFVHVPSKGFASPAVEYCCAERDCLVSYPYKT
jgi:hypothetical protein